VELVWVLECYINSSLADLGEYEDSFQPVTLRNTCVVFKIHSVDRMVNTLLQGTLNT
jgi:hypothetical protein